MKTIEIHTEYITLGQFLKFAGIIDAGGEAKDFIENNTIYVQKCLENRRGKKLYDGFIIEIKDESYLIRVKI